MDQHEIESYKKAGSIAAQVKEYARELIKPGMKLIDIALAIDDKIAELGAKPAFPVNLSLNDIAAHYTPTLGAEEIVQGVLKVDIGIAIDGYIADTAITLDFTEGNDYKEMIELNKKALNKVMSTLAYGIELKTVGDCVQDVLEEWNENNENTYAVIKGLSGHQIAQNIIHAGLTVSNYRNDNTTELKDMAIAVEPFFSTGNGEIYEGIGGGIYGLRKDDVKPRDRNAREILAFIKEEFKTRPFCSRWIEKAGHKNVRYALKLLEQQGIIHHYPLLIEKSGGIVSQFENTFLFAEEKVTITTYEEGWLEK